MKLHFMPVILEASFVLLQKKAPNIYQRDMDGMAAAVAFGIGYTFGCHETAQLERCRFEQALNGRGLTMRGTVQ